MLNPLKQKALERDRFKCQFEKEDGTICGRTTRLTMHHIIPKSDGGPDTLENVVIWCEKCHVDYNRRKSIQRAKRGRFRREVKYSIEWDCKPGLEKCVGCTRANCLNWPDGFIEALVMLLATGEIGPTEISRAGVEASVSA